MVTTDVPVLEMLWEARDAGEVLAERFGFEAADDVGRWVCRTLADHWGVRADSCDRVVMSDRNALAWVRTGESTLVVKWSVAEKRFGLLAETARLTGWLGYRGLPVSAPVPALDGRLQVEADAVSIGLQRHIDAKLLDTGDLGMVHEVGATLARLHRELAAYPGRAGLDGLLPRPAALAERMAEWLEADRRHLPKAALQTLRRLVDQPPCGLPPVQIVHGDVRAANVLCADGEVAAVIDFEEIRLDHRIVELARAAVLLGTRFHDWRPVTAEVRAAFLSGYRAVSDLTDAEKAWWGPLLLWNALGMIPPGDDPTGWTRAAVEIADEAETSPA